MSPLFRVVDWPLRAKMSALLVLASLLPLGIATLVEIHQARERLKLSTADLLAARGDHLVDQLDFFHRTYQRTAQRLARLPEVASALQSHTEASSQASIPAVLEIWPATDKNLRGVALLDLTGKVRCATEASLVGLDLSYRGFVREAIRSGNNETLVSDVHLAESQVGHTPTIAYLAPVLSQGKRIGHLAIWARADGLWQIMKQSNELAGPRSFAVLFDHHGIRVGHTYNDDIVFHPGGALAPALVDELVAERRFGARTRELLEGVRAFPEQFDRALAETPDRGLFYGFAPVNQKWNYGVGRRFQTVPWTVFYMIPEQHLNGQIAEMTWSKSLYAGAMGLAAILAGMLFAAITVRPIRSLSRATELVAKGDRTARVVVTGDDELGRLGTGFNSMAEQIEVQDAALQKSREELESRVQQRTAEVLGKSEELIAERTQSERVLRESQERLHAVMENITEGVVISDLDGQILHFNRTALNMLGFARPEDSFRTVPEYLAFFELSTSEAES